MLNNTKEILTLKELQELLHIGKNTALRLVQSGEIDAFRVGNQWRVLSEYSAQVEHPRPPKLNSRVARNEHFRR